MFKQPLDPSALIEFHGPDGHVWKIWDNGYFQGFPEGTMIVSRLFRLKPRPEILKGDESRKVDLPSAISANKTV